MEWCQKVGSQPATKDHALFCVPIFLDGSEFASTLFNRNHMVGALEAVVNQHHEGWRKQARKFDVNQQTWRVGEELETGIPNIMCIYIYICIHIYIYIGNWSNESVFCWVDGNGRVLGSSPLFWAKGAATAWFRPVDLGDLIEGCSQQANINLVRQS